MPKLRCTIASKGCTNPDGKGDTRNCSNCGGPVCRKCSRKIRKKRYCFTCLEFLDL